MVRAKGARNREAKTALNARCSPFERRLGQRTMRTRPAGSTRSNASGQRSSGRRQTSSQPHQTRATAARRAPLPPTHTQRAWFELGLASDKRGGSSGTGETSLSHSRGATGASYLPLPLPLDLALPAPCLLAGWPLRQTISLPSARAPTTTEHRCSHLQSGLSQDDWL
jgi:hypothetical protein